MAKSLKVTFPKKCNGCELCVYEVQRQLKKVGLDGSPIRIFRNKESDSIFGNITFEINIDNSVNSLDIKKISKICPTKVYTIEEVEEEEKLLQ